MSTKSNTQGRAYEYICLLTLYNEISKYRSVEIVYNSMYDTALNDWLSVGTTLQNILKDSAKAAVTSIFDMEPLIVEQSNDILKLCIQQDKKGEKGDVRDIVISRENIRWEIGLSIKHNHFAVKHSRIADSLDFGQKWYNIPCSEIYWNDIRPIFDYLETQKNLKKNWKDLPDKKNAVYIPILQAFIDEIKRSYNLDSGVPKRMVEYLLGEFDFYKVISIDSRHITQIQTFNLHGKLNQASKIKVPKIKIPVASLPTRIVSINFKPNSTNTVELYMDGGWQFSFRIHNAATAIESSLKFDIRIVGMPTTIISIDCFWS